jgi:hypothetical protein
MQEGIDTTGFPPPFPRRKYEFPGNAGDLALLTFTAPGLFGESSNKLVFVREQRCA